MSQDPHGPKERLVDAYERMMERVHTALEHAGKDTLPNLQRLIDQAADKAVELKEVTREDVDRIAGYFKRDVEDAAQFLNNSGDELSRWLRFDLDLMEDRLLDMFSLVADRTSVEWMDLADRAWEASLYRTGEVTGPGTLQCTVCEELLHFHKAAHIPPCPACHGTEFRRPGEDATTNAD